MDGRPSSMWFFPLWHCPNGLMVIFQAITVVLNVWSVGLTVIMFSTAILLRHGEVPCCTVMISQRSSIFENLPSAKSLL
jgi:hypothetical protein